MSHVITQKSPLKLTIVISEEEQQRILASDTFHHFLSRSSKIVERALDEDYDLLVDYTQDVEANQYITFRHANIGQPKKVTKLNKWCHSTRSSGAGNAPSPL